MNDHDGVPALEFSGLFKQFFDNIAVDHIDPEVPSGSFFGLVGPNGAAMRRGTSSSKARAIGGLALVVFVLLLAVTTLLTGVKHYRYPGAGPTSWRR